MKDGLALSGMTFISVRGLVVRKYVQSSFQITIRIMDADVTTIFSREDMRKLASHVALTGEWDGVYVDFI